MAIADIVHELIPGLFLKGGRTLVIDEQSSSFSYIGTAEAGTEKSEAKWRIFRVFRQGTVYTVEQAASLDYDNVWDDRISLFPTPVLTNSYSVHFDGVNDYLDLGTTTFTEMDIGQQWSMSFWIKVNNFSLQNAMYGKTTVEPYGFWFYISTGGVLQATARTATYNRTRVGTTVLSTGVWTNVVLTYSGNMDASGIKFYINGVEDSASGTGPLTASLHTGQRATIGARGGLSTFFSGNIDEPSFWSKQLNQTEVTELYNSGQPSNLIDFSAYNNLLSWWRMGDGDTYPTILDHKGSANGTMTNQTSGDIQGDVP